MRSDDHTARMSNSRFTAWSLVAALGPRDACVLEDAHDLVAGVSSPCAQLALLVLAGLISRADARVEGDPLSFGHCFPAALKTQASAVRHAPFDSLHAKPSRELIPSSTGTN